MIDKPEAISVQVEVMTELDYMHLFSNTLQGLLVLLAYTLIPFFIVHVNS